MAEYISSFCSLFDWHLKRKSLLNSTTEVTSSSLRKAPHPTVHNFNYVYYLELSNGSRLRQYVPIHYDDRKAQTIFLHVVLMGFASPGFFMPLLLYMARKKGKYQVYYVWWICWITLHNVHSLVDMFVMFNKCLIHFRCFRPAFLYNTLASITLNCGSVCYLANFFKEAVTPLTLHLSLLMLRYYRRISLNVESPSSNSSSACLTELNIDFNGRRGKNSGKKRTTSISHSARSFAMGSKRRATTFQVIEKRENEKFLSRALGPTLNFGCSLVRWPNGRRLK
uniref:Uncharacterized protein n=1 Tax=Ditylenchus dipsaci TaxID=166011 RepID=A0A915CR56_9BILA